MRRLTIFGFSVPTTRPAITIHQDKHGKICLCGQRRGGFLKRQCRARYPTRSGVVVNSDGCDMRMTKNTENTTSPLAI